MKSFSHRLAFAFTLTAILWTTSTAMAQRRSGGGFGGFGGFGGGGGSGSTVGILLRDSNAEELKLTDEQKTKIREISDKLREDTRVRDLLGKMLTASEEDRTAATAEMAKIQAEQRTQSDADLKKVLSAEQFTRYRQLALQQRGVNSLGDSDVASELKLSDEQVAKLKALSEESGKKMRNVHRRWFRRCGHSNQDDGIPKRVRRKTP